MRLVSFRQTDGEKPRTGALLPDRREVLDFTSPALDLPVPAEPLGWLDLAGESFRAARAAWAKVGADGRLAGELRAASAILPRPKVRLTAPVPRPGKVICIGLNYRDHAAESGMPLPETPICFSKFATSVTGPNDPVVVPPGSFQCDWEAELAVVIGRRAARITEAEAYEHVLGYTCFNDVSARDFQFADGQWQRGKSCDTFAPMGECIVTTDEVPDPHALRIRLRLNGETMQDSSTDQLVFGVPALVSFLSRAFTLEPGDVIATGTPPGVGFARKPPLYLKPGDVMEVEIESLGVLRNHVVA